MPFKFEPQEIPEDHLWCGRTFHWTWKGFIAKADIFVTIGAATTVPVIGWSIVHEDTSFVDDQGVEHVGYKHTHAGVIFFAKIKIKGCRKFDIRIIDDNGFPDYIHPHIQPGVTMSHMETIFADYHAGRKFSVELGKTVFKAPIWRDFKLPPMWEFARATMEEMIAAPSLVEACIAGQIRPRNVNDVKMLRESAGHEAKQFKHLFDPSTFITLPLPPWDALWVWGATGLGKTKWACAQATNPCLIKPFNSIGCLEMVKTKFQAGFHDLLILDEADLRFMDREAVIVFLDTDEDCVMSIRFTKFEIPAGVKKIFLSNPNPLGTPRLVPTDASGAIDRRLTVHMVDQKLWVDPLAASPPVADATAAGTPVTQVIGQPDFSQANAANTAQI